MPKITQGLVLAVATLLILGVAIAAPAAQAPPKAAVVGHESGCKPFPAPCGETMDWSAGVGYSVVLEQQQLEAFLASIAPKASSGGGGGGRYPRGCVGGESACIPTTPGTCVLPSYICARESSAINKWNYGGSGASGKYQAMPSTWGGYAGFQYAADAPEAIQDLWASELWNNGAGCSHWSAC